MLSIFKSTIISNTVRELIEKVTIVATANSEDSIDLLKLAGANHVIQLGKMMGRSLSRRTIGHDSRVHIVGRGAAQVFKKREMDYRIIDKNS